MSRHSSVAEAALPMDDHAANLGANLPLGASHNNNDDYSMVQPAAGKSNAPVVRKRKLGIAYLCKLVNCTFVFMQVMRRYFLVLQFHLSSCICMHA